MKAICFFNHYHNGDLFYNKEFVRDIMSKIPTQYYYAHTKDKKILSDLNIQPAGLSAPDKIRMFEAKDQNIVCVNTWIGSYFDLYPGECTLRFNYRMFQDIYNDLNKIFETSIKPEPIEHYLAKVDYSKFDVSSIDEYLKTDSNKKILFSNGPGLSGQCSYNGDMSDIITDIAKKNRDKTFIATQRFHSEESNVKFTSDIINVQGSDLNEISYLSRFCDVIIGKDSGPFCFTHTEENLMNPNKTFLSFGDDVTTSHVYGLDFLKSDFIIEKFTSLENLKSKIESII